MMPSACVWVVFHVCDVIFLFCLFCQVHLLLLRMGCVTFLLVVWFVCGGWCVRYFGRMVDALAC